MAKAFVQRDTAVTGKYYVEAEGGGSGGGGVSYSTEEQDTGLKWIDGSPIYQKTVVYTNAIAVNQTTTLAIANYIGADVAQIIEINGITGNGIPINACWPQGGYNWGITTYANGGNITIVNASNAITDGLYITVKYTKTE